MRITNYISGIITIVIGGFFYAMTFGFKKLGSQLIGADFMPRVYCILLIFLGFILLIQGYRDKSENDDKKGTIIHSLGAMITVVLYIIAIPYIGFYLGTFLMVLGMLIFTKIVNKFVLFLVPLGAAVFVYVAFEKLLSVSIPHGMLFS